MSKLITWIVLNGASVIGIAQACLKCGKEVSTAVVNLLSVAFPAAKAQAIVVKVRDFFNAVDAFVEKYKGAIIK
jgi:hypothetical protein